MSEEENEIENAYLTYNGLNRPAMVAGVPIGVFLISGGICLLSGLLLSNFIGVYSLIPIVICILACVISRIVCEDDPNAINVLTLKIKGMIQKKFKILCIRGGK